MLTHIRPSLHRFTVRLVLKIQLPIFFFRALCPVMLSSQHRHAPRAPLPTVGVTSRGVALYSTSEGITLPSSLILAHGPDQNPPAVFDLTITTDLCRLSSVPARSWSFPSLSLQSLRRCLDPYPAMSFRCTCSLLPGKQRPHIKGHTFGTPNLSL